jgi:hypothetical protein
METAQFQERLYHAFIRGYQDVAAGATLHTADPQTLSATSLIQAAASESRELRRSIDACRSAMTQLADLPESEKEALRGELRSTLDCLNSASDDILARLKRLQGAPESSDNPEPRQSDEPPPPHPEGRVTKPSRRR